MISPPPPLWWPDRPYVRHEEGNSSRVAGKQLEQPLRSDTFPFPVQISPIAGVSWVHARVVSPLVRKCDGFPRGRSGFNRREIEDRVAPRIFLPDPLVQFAPPDVHIFLPEKSFREGDEKCRDRFRRPQSSVFNDFLSIFPFGVFGSSARNDTYLGTMNVSM